MNGDKTISNINYQSNYAMPDYGVVPCFGHTNTGKTSALLTLINLFYSQLPDVALIYVGAHDHAVEMKEHLEIKSLIPMARIQCYTSTDKIEEQLDDLLKHADRKENNLLIFLFDDLQQHQPSSIKWINKHTNTSRHSRTLITFTAHSLDGNSVKGFYNNVLMSAEKIVLTVHELNNQLLSQFLRKTSLNIDPKTIAAIKKIPSDLYPFIIMDIATQSVVSNIFTTLYSTDI